LPKPARRPHAAILPRNTLTH